MKFYLQDVSNGSPGVTIASTTARVVSPLDISCWGDSLTQGAGSSPGLPYPIVLQNLIPGAMVVNEGIGGETSTQIEERFLANSSDRGNFTVIWAGRNNYGETAQILSDIKNMVDALPSPKKFVVLSVLNGNFPNEYIGQSGYNLIASVNKALESAYPKNFIDIRSYLISQSDTQNPQDLVDHHNDVPPTSLRSDAIHLTAAGYALVAEEVAKFIVSNTAEE
jgi:lysophospholipase L1-like esterase